MDISMDMSMDTHMEMLIKSKAFYHKNEIFIFSTLYSPKTSFLFLKSVLYSPKTSPK
jgi:hypothetical protein